MHTYRLDLHHVPGYTKTGARHHTATRVLVFLLFLPDLLLSRALRIPPHPP